MNFSRRELITLIVYTFFILLAIILPLINGFLFYWLFVRDYNLNVSVINFYEIPVEVEIGQDRQVLEHFDTHIFNIKSSDQQKGFVYDASSGNLIEDFSIREISDSPYIAIHPLHFNRPFCIVKADVTEVYYGNEDKIGVSEIQHIKDFNNNNFKFFLNNTIYVYPGKTSIADMPSEIRNNQRIIGYYPIECDLVNNLEEIDRLAKIYKYFNAEQQRNNFNNQIENNITIPQLAE